MSPIRYHGVLLWNGVVGDGSSVGTLFGTCFSPDAIMRAYGLVYPLFVARTTWFGMLDVCSVKGKLLEYGVECHEIHDRINI